MSTAPEVAKHFELTEVADGVHVAIARDGGWALSNAGVIDLGERTVAFDAQLHPAAALDLCRASVRVTGRRPDLVVNSHYHGDHMLGNQAFLPASIATTARTRELSLTRGVAELESDSGSAEDRLIELRAGKAGVMREELALYDGWYEAQSRYAQDRVRIVPADITFESGLTLHGARRFIQVLSYGGGHSDSDAFLHVPEAGVLFAGDLLSKGFHPWVSDGHPDAWSRILRDMLRLPFQTVVPGHGPVGSKNDLEQMIGYLDALSELAEEARTSGVARDALGQFPMPERYRSWKFSTFWAQSLEFLYDQKVPPA